jgi:hypothetical protein
MNKMEILKKLAPCGLSCEKCFAFADGNIRHYSGELKKALGNFAPFAKRFSDLLEEPVFNMYPYFDLQLDHFTKVKCKGCRVDNCLLFKSCRVCSCSANKEVDFCFQCDEFPCKHSGFDENLYNRWVRINTRMKEVGVETYYQENKELPRYQ